MFKKLLNSVLSGLDEVKEQAMQQVAPPAPACAPRYEPEPEPAAPEVEFDPETLHGTHYTIEEFDAAVEVKVQAWIAQEAAEGTTLGQKDIDNLYFNFRRDVYCDWTGADSDQMIQWELANSMVHRGTATSGFTKDDPDNPLLQPIHGLSLKDYAAITLKISQGVDVGAICTAMGIEPAIWEEVNVLWCKRMQEDDSFTVQTLFGQYFSEGASHPKLAALQAGGAAGGNANLDRLRSDRYFYEELCGARQAAYEYGLDGAQWILENFAISLGDFQAVAMEHLTLQNQNWNSDDATRYMDYQQEKQKEYAAKFAAEQGGNIADDVSF
ncbi:MAG: DUF6620 family protein [Azonexus sp.]